MRKITLTLALGLGLVATGGTASAMAGVTDVGSSAGVSQTDQSFDTMPFDYNSDGLQDVLYSPQNDSAHPGRQLWRQNADGTFTLVTRLVATAFNDQHGCTTADYDHNGLQDVYCTLGAVHGSRTKANPLWLQSTPDVFTLDETSGATDGLGRSYSASTLDANQDGWPDLFVDDFHPRPDGLPTPDRLYLNLGSDPVTGAWLGFSDAGAASGIEQEEGNRGCDFTTDVNGDGHADIVFCGSARMYFYEGDGAGHFTDASSALGLASFFSADAKLVDVNGDGLTDLVFAKLAQWGVRLRKANGTFAAVTQAHTMTAARIIEPLDINGDGHLDLYVLQGNGQPGCTGCPTNYPDHLYLGNGTGTSWTDTTIPEVTGAQGDTADAIRVGSASDVFVGNGANLVAGPVQLLAWVP